MNKLVSDTGSGESLVSNTRYWFEIKQRFFLSTVNISFAKVAITTEFLLATSEVYSPMASVRPLALTQIVLTGMVKTGDGFSQPTLLCTNQAQFVSIFQIS